jgi:surface antigen
MRLRQGDPGQLEEPAMKLSPVALGLVAALSLGGCANRDYGTKQTVGALAGAGAGGLLGAQIGKGKGQLAATAAGTVLGAFLGNEVGKSLDRADRLYAGKAQYQALEYAPAGNDVAWQNPDSGHYGSVRPLRTYQATSGAYCREFQQQAAIGGEVQAVYGTACRQPDGQWQVID